MDGARAQTRALVLALAYLKLYRSTYQPLWLDRARKLIDALLASGLTSSGYLRQGILTKAIEGDRRLRSTSKDAQTMRYLRPQVQVGVALVELAEATQDSAYLEMAERYTPPAARPRTATQRSGC